MCAHVCVYVYMCACACVSTIFIHCMSIFRVLGAYLCFLN